MKNIAKNSFERVQLARHPDRPYTNDLLSEIFTDFIEIHGDRRYADDAAIVCGFAKIGEYDVAVIGQQKGRDTNQRRYRNFGMPKPEGYRKALRIMKMAEKFGRPLVTFIDTPGAYPGIDAEERGQAEAIAFNLREMSNLKVSTIVVVLGEGGSGGALAIGVGDRILMMENSVYSVISPEGCAAILWKDSSQANRAAESLRLTAVNLKDLGIIDEIIGEDYEWRLDASDDIHNKSFEENFQKTASDLKVSILKHLEELENLAETEKLDRRFEKFRKMGRWIG
jgi:acetyl-CoA carboxylase carboxyl transferase subunit alpha